MPKSVFRSLLLGALGALALVACAVGSDDEGTGQGIVPNEPDPAEAGAVAYDPPKPTDAKNKDAGADAKAPTDGGTDASQPTGTTCAAPTSCSGGEDLGSFTGDDNTKPAGERTVTRSGSTGAWFKMHLTEDVNIILPYDMKVRADLIGPPTGAGNVPGFSVFVYVAANTTDNACSASPRSAAGSSQTVPVTITDSLGVTDSRDVYIEVRETANAGANVCKAAASWSLTVTTAE